MDTTVERINEYGLSTEKSRKVAINYLLSRNKKKIKFLVVELVLSLAVMSAIVGALCYGF